MTSEPLTTAAKLDGAESSREPLRGLPRRGGALARGISIVAVLAVIAVVVREVLAGGGELSRAARRLSHPALLWLGAAVAAEALSYVLYARAQRRLVGRGQSQLSVRWLTALAVCAQGVINFLPAGYVAANLLNFRELRRRGLAASASGGLLVLTSCLYIGALALLTVVTGAIAGGHATGALASIRIGAFAVLAALPVLGMLVWRLVARGLLRLPGAWGGGARRLRPRLPARLTARVAATAASIFLASWLADAGCLVASIRAVGAHPNWGLVPIAYCAAQLVAFLPITPGGLGLVEGSLTVTLVAAGGGAPVLAAVLLYRIISYWATLPCGLLGYLYVGRGGRAGMTDVNDDGDRAPALGDRAPGLDRPLLVLEG